MKEALFWKPEKTGIRCGLCARRCLISEGGVGFCRVRKNIAGRLVSLVYGKVASLNLDPIQKKPFFHFAPGTDALSFSTVGCNFQCKFCCNFPLSQEWKHVFGEDLSPAQIVALAKKRAQGLCYTYMEPTMFYEFALDCAKLAKGMYNCWVTNGYTTPEPIAAFKKLDAAVVDFKGSGNPEFYRRFAQAPKVEPIFESLKAMKAKGIHIEVTDLIVPKYGDSAEDAKMLAEWIKNNLGPEIPFHVLRFHPDYKLLDLPSTPMTSIEKAVNVAKDVGLRYVNGGNVPGQSTENTYCPSCGDLLIERWGFSVIQWNLTNEVKCPKCGTAIPIIVK